MEIKAAHIIFCEGKEYKLCEPTFDIYALAMSKYITGSGELNLVGAGQVVFDGCYIGNDLEDIKTDVKLYANLCLQAASIVEFLEAEIKKN